MCIPLLLPTSPRPLFHPDAVVGKTQKTREYSTADAHQYLHYRFADQNNKAYVPKIKAVPFYRYRFFLSHNLRHEHNHIYRRRSDKKLNTTAPTKSAVIMKLFKNFVR